MEEIENKEELEALLINKRFAMDDDGFTEELMRKLPYKRKSYLVIYLSLAMGIGVAFLWGGLEKTVYQMAVFVNSLTQFRIPSADNLFIALCVLLTFVLASSLIFSKNRNIA